MKRQREDSGGAPPPRGRPLPPGGRPGDAGEAHGGGASRLTTDDALGYLREVKERFKDQKNVYYTFLDIMKDFKSARIDTYGVIVRVKELFFGHSDLIMGFNTFLPKGYEIEVPPPETTRETAKLPKQPVEFDQAINYVNKIKSRFSKDEGVYKAFLEILNLYRKGQKTISQVYEEVAVLFQDHSDLLKEFCYFLPESTAPDNQEGGGAGGPRPPPPSSHDAQAMMRRGEPMGKPRMVLPKQPPKLDRPAGPMGLLPGGSEGDLPGRVPTHKRKGVRMRPEDMARGPVGAPKPSSMGGGYEGSDGGAPGGGAAGREGSQLAGDGVKKFPRPGNMGRELAFFDKVRTRLRSAEGYQDFVKLLHLFHADVVTRAELSSLMFDVLGRFPDLMTGFQDFLARCEACEFEGADAVMRAREARLASSADISGREGGSMQGNTPAAPPPAARPRPSGVSGFQSGQHHPTDSLYRLPVSELDLSNSERCTPSYRLLPKHYPRGKCSGRTPMIGSLLNDQWVSVTSGSEDYSFKNMRKNQYEESLFRCEDDRFELDMVIESNMSTLAVMTRLNERLCGLAAEERAALDLHTEMSPIHLRCVERIYGDHGPSIVELLQKNPGVAIPVIMARLKQKDEEWRAVRTEMNKVWRDVYAKNYYKSLDHRSFYFKQVDKKNLSARGLVSEIKEVSEKRKQAEEDSILACSVAAFGPRGAGRPLTSLSADLAFDLRDDSVHEDVYRILKFAAREMLSTDTAARVMAFWTGFVERFLGLPPRTREAEGEEEAVAASTGKVAHAEDLLSGGAGAGEDEVFSEDGKPLGIKLGEGEDEEMEEEEGALDGIQLDENGEEVDVEDEAAAAAAALVTGGKQNRDAGSGKGKRSGSGKVKLEGEAGRRAGESGRGFTEAEEAEMEAAATAGDAVGLEGGTEDEADGSPTGKISGGFGAKAGGKGKGGPDGGGTDAKDDDKARAAASTAATATTAPDAKKSAPAPPVATAAADGKKISLAAAAASLSGVAQEREGSGVVARGSKGGAAGATPESAPGASRPSPDGAGSGGAVADASAGAGGAKPGAAGSVKPALCSGAPGGGAGGGGAGATDMEVDGEAEGEGDGSGGKSGKRGDTGAGGSSRKRGGRAGPGDKKRQEASESGAVTDASTGGKESGDASTGAERDGEPAKGRGAEGGNEAEGKGRGSAKGGAGARRGGDATREDVEEGEGGEGERGGPNEAGQEPSAVRNGAAGAGAGAGAAVSTVVVKGGTKKVRPLAPAMDLVRIGSGEEGAATGGGGGELAASGQVSGRVDSSSAGNSGSNGGVGAANNAGALVPVTDASAAGGYGTDKPEGGDRGGEGASAISPVAGASSSTVVPAVTAAVTATGGPGSGGGAGGAGAGAPAGVHSKVLFGHDALYILFRLHQVIYDRLCVAKQTAAQLMEGGWKPNASQVAAGADENTDLYHTFLRALFALLEGTVDNAKYEDDCRALLGTSSYVLFTLDKVVLKLEKQLQLVNSDELSLKLIGMQNYESSRGRPVAESVYFANCCMLLADEPCYRLEVAKDPHRRLAITCLDRGPDKSELLCGAMEGSFADYLGSFLHCKPSMDDDGRGSVYLGRNMARKPDSEEAYVRALEDMSIINGLECKISCSTSKVSYVLDTEDVLLRHRRKRATSGRKQHRRGAKPAKVDITVKKFTEWVERRVREVELEPS
eukprot:jgi/Mesvir1/17460/Mv08734-RA.1